MAAAPIYSARQGPLSRFRRWLVTTGSPPLKVFVIPGPDVLRAQGLDLGLAGLEIAHTPRAADVLLITGPLPAGLAENAAVVFAQIPRPRLLAALGEPVLGSLPPPAIQLPLSQPGLLELCAAARRLLSDDAWSPAVQPFAPAFIKDALAEQEQQGGTGNMDYDAMDHSKMDHSQMNNGEMDHNKMDHSKMSHGQMDHRKMNHGEPQSQSPPPAAEEPMHQHEEPAGHPSSAKPVDEVSVIPIPAPDHSTHHHQPPATATPAASKPVNAHLEHSGHHQMGSEPPTPASESHAAPPATGHDHAAMMKKAESKAGDAPAPPAGPPGMAGMTGMAGMDMSGDTDKVAMKMDDPADAKGKMDHDMPGMKMGDPAGAGIKMDHNMVGMDMDHDMAGMDMSGGEMGFMSMVSMTKDLPRSADGLPMEATEAAFGPFFPGLPGGLDLRLHLDGDTVTKAVITSGLLGRDFAGRLPVPAVGFADWLADLDPLTPVTYRALARRALAQASGQPLPESELLAQMRQLEQERIASHLNWLIGFSLTIGHAWLRLAAERLYQRVQQGTARPAEVAAFSQKVRRLPLLRGSLEGIGAMPVVLQHHARGPVARAAGQVHDARQADPLYQRLGFAPVVLAEDNAWGRLLVRLAEIAQSQALLDQIGPLPTPPPAAEAGPATGQGHATLETPRGAATLAVEVKDGQVTAFTLHGPSTRHVALANELVREMELGDALKTIASLDISPWETDR